MSDVNLPPIVVSVPGTILSFPNPLTPTGIPPVSPPTASLTDTPVPSPSDPPPSNTGSTSLPTDSSSMSSSTGSNASHTDVPVTAASTSSHRHAGAIAGGVVGGLAVVVAIVAALLYYRYKRRQPYRIRSRGGRRSVVGGPFKKWSDGDLSSGYSLPASDNYSIAKQAPARHASTGSTAAMIPSYGYGYGNRTATIPGFSNEDVSSMDEEKPPSTPSTSQHGHKPADLTEPIPPLPTDSAPTTPTSAAFPNGRTRTRSLTNQNRALALAKLNSTSPTAPRSPYPPISNPYAAEANRLSFDGRMLPHATSPFTASTEMIKLNRSSSGAKRMQRKAVPKYDESEFGSATTPPSQAADESHNSHSARTSTSNLHTTKSREDLASAGLEIPSLNHKTSFGENQAVHYLIPDQPPPTRD